MNTDIKGLQPNVLWQSFANLNAIPRASKKEEAVIAFMVAFGKGLGLDTITDAVGNVIIRKPATPKFEDRVMVTLQSHLDMVHQKNKATVFDFDTEGIKMIIDGDWVKAEGTTLGADNGIGVAAIMALLESTAIEHPALEALFTIDEETGMTGAQGLQPNVLQGAILLNLDTEEDDEIDIGCAGGVDITATNVFKAEEVSENTKSFKLIVRGLKGGHSGIEIHKGLGNANKIMNRVLVKLTKSVAIRISEIDGGSLRNAIPRESTASVVVSIENVAKMLEKIQKYTTLLKEELKIQDPALEIVIEEVKELDSVMSIDSQDLLLKAISAAHNGVYSMSASMEGLVETSNNIARVIVKGESIYIGCLTRSSITSGKEDLVHNLQSTFELASYTVKESGDYPGWNPNPNSAIVKIVSERYTELFMENARVVACHAGLECGLLGTHYPEMDMVSFGPTIKGAHSPDEKVCISSVQKFWGLLIDVLGHIPKK